MSPRAASLTSRSLIPAPDPSLPPEVWVHALAFATSTPLPEYFEPWTTWVDRLAQATGNVFDVPRAEPSMTFSSWSAAFYKANG